ncbi:MAG: hypothetical protein ACXIVO_07800 [Glycocaulis sp.]
MANSDICDPLILDLIGEPPAAPDAIDSISEAELADLFGITARQLRNLAYDGVIRKAGRGRFEFRASVRGYTESLRAKCARGRSKDDPEHKAERVRLARAQAEKVELQNAKARSELVSADEVTHAWAAILRDVRAGMLAVPSRIGTRLPALTGHDISEIEAEIRAALERLADGND